MGTLPRTPSRAPLRLVDSGMDSQRGEEPETIGDCLTTFAHALRADNSANRTVAERTGHIRTYHRTTGRDPRDISRADVAQWLGRAHLSRNSRHTYAGHLRSWTRWLTDTGRVNADPLAGMKRPRANKITPRPTPQVVLDTILEQSAGRLHTYILLEAFQGFRAHEVAKIRGEDITSWEMMVRGKGGRVDTLPTHPLVWEQAALYPRVGWWFPTSSKYGHVLGHTVTTQLTRAFTRAGTAGHGHQLRAYYATALLRGGADAETLMGLMRHESLVSTQRYLGACDERRRAAILTLGRAA